MQGVALAAHIHEVLAHCQRPAPRSIYRRAPGCIGFIRIKNSLKLKFITTGGTIDKVYFDAKNVRD